MLFEVRCAGCGALGWCPCADCIAALGPPQAVSVPGAAGTALLFAHEGIGREFIHALKYRGERAIARWLGEALAMAALAQRGDTALIDPALIDTVTWAPTTPARRRARGFDQAEVLARATAKALRVRPMRLLARRGTAAQSGTGRAERLAGPEFRVYPRATGRRVLLIDDVITTGATLSAATAELNTVAAVVHVAACAQRARLSPDEPAADERPAGGGLSGSLLSASRLSARQA